MKNTEIKELEDKLLSITEQQNNISKEISEVKEQLNKLKNLPEEVVPADMAIEEPPVIIAPPPISIEKEEEEAPEIAQKPAMPMPPPPIPHQAPETNTNKKSKWSLEKFIGENLINKIGIIITIIGVAIGVKYSIENHLLSPLVRVIIGYIIGLVLMGFGIKLKKKYENYSAVLVSGSIAILYFITYAGYDFYNLIPSVVAFFLMLIFTIFATVAAIHYNRQIIAHIGLVGAYAIPFLVSSNSGKTAILFTYIAIINIGILLISYKKYWKSLYYSAFAFTWIIFGSWYLFKYDSTADFTLAVLFLTVFFLIFYTMFLVYKLVKKENYSQTDIISLLINSFIFFGIGYSILDSYEYSKNILGLFALANAVIHFIVSLIIYRQKLVDKKLLYFTITLVLTFITIAIPIQLDGSWVTLIWLAEAGLLFCIGRTKQIGIYEKIAYPLMLLAVISLVQDWVNVYDKSWNNPEPVFNACFLTSVIAIVVFGIINYFYFSLKYTEASVSSKFYRGILNFFIPATLIVIAYCAFELEIVNYCKSIYNNAISAETEIFDSYAHQRLGIYPALSSAIYSLLFVSVLSLINNLKIKSRKLGFATIALFILFMLVFLTSGLYDISELREIYLENPVKYNIDIAIRYISIAAFGITLFAFYWQIKQDYLKPVNKGLKIYFDFIFYGSLLWILSSELIHWLDMAGYAETYKLGLSILWGVYALAIIASGIWKNRKYMRISGIAIFGVTLVKLFFYDLTALNTLSKTIIFIALGILMLIVSFLYNKYKHLITDDVEQKD